MAISFAPLACLLFLSNTAFAIGSAPAKLTGILMPAGVFGR
jgi:hypothetical protein